MLTQNDQELAEILDDPDTELSATVWTLWKRLDSAQQSAALRELQALRSDSEDE